jgi:O-antigen ligase
VILVALLIMPPQVQERLGIGGETNKAAASSTERRLTYVTFGMDLFMESPIVGLGLGSFADRYAHSKFEFFRTGDEVARIAHNMYLEILIAMGILGFVPFILLLVMPLFWLQQIVTNLKLKAMGEIAKMVQISLLAFLTIGVFSSSQFDKPLWLLVGLASIIPTILKMEEKEREERLQGI